MNTNIKKPNKIAQEKFFKACKTGKLSHAEKLLSNHTIDVNGVTVDHKTPLYLSINSHSLPLVKFLIKHGADVNRKSFVFIHIDCSAPNFESCDEPPLVTAARSGTSDILKCLLQAGCSANLRPEIATNHNAVLKFPGASALHFACESAHVEMVRLLLSNGADVDAEDRRHERSLHIAVRCKGPACVRQCEIVQLLCKSGADVQSLNRKQCSPLHLAALYGCALKAQILIRHGACVNGRRCLTDRDAGYGSALHVAAYKDRLALAAIMLSNGAKINHVNASGQTPLQLNISVHNRSNIAPLLIFHGARINDVDRNGRTLLASCIAGPRLDCESLAVLMVQAGYNLNRDRWLIPEVMLFADEERPTRRLPFVPVPVDVRVGKLCEWLRWKQTSVRSLSELCRVVVRRHLSRCIRGRSIISSIKHLPLPTALKNFILLKDPSGTSVEYAILNFLNNDLG